MKLVRTEASSVDLDPKLLPLYQDRGQIATGER